MNNTDLGRLKSTIKHWPMQVALVAVNEDCAWAVDSPGAIQARTGNPT